LPRPPIAFHVEQLVERPPVHTLITEDVFLGGVLDTGAQKSVSGPAQAHAYCKTYNLEMHLTESNGKLIFGDTVCRSLGHCRLLVPTPDGDKTVDAHVVEGNIPFLIGLDTIDVHGWNCYGAEHPRGGFYALGILLLSFAICTGPFWYTQQVLLSTEHFSLHNPRHRYYYDTK
jgi:hypothetical protein